MKGTIRGAALALMLPLAAAGCAGGSTSGDRESGPGIGGSLVRAVMGQRRAAAEPQAAPDPQGMAARALAINPGPLILVGLEQLGTTQVLALTGENRGMRTFMTSGEQSVIMRGMMLSGTRGLGNDLSVAEADQSAALIAAGRSGTARRVMRYYSGDGLERPLDFTCRIAPGPNAGVMVETCQGHGLRFENSYLPARGISRQWVGPALGYATVQVLRN